MDLFTKAAELGIQTGFHDGQGQWHTTDEAALKIILDAMPVRTPHRFVDSPVVIRAGEGARTVLNDAAAFPLNWTIHAAGKVIAEGVTEGREIAWPADLPVGVHRLKLVDAKKFPDEAPFIVAPSKAFPGEFDRSWIVAVQLYGVRSERNWGIGDFTDLQDLIRLAAEIGAGGIGLNPLHALFDDRPAECSPYSPNSRLFLNPLYIDVEALPEYAAGDSGDTLANMRASKFVDYSDIASAKSKSDARGVRDLLRGAKFRTSASLRRLPRRACAAADALCLFRSAAPSASDGMVGLAQPWLLPDDATCEASVQGRTARTSPISNMCSGMPICS